ncbi:MAG: cytochrome c maturation protein CcmE [Armatimonadetes bacterium]|nr:cytochrome c maturation protein CcmE [Armatimonadota bacterium]
MRVGAIVSGVLALGAAVGLTAVFVNNASPYLTIHELEGKDQTVHVVGKIVPSTLEQNTMAQEVRFELKDDTGTMPVRYTGPPQSNLAAAQQVVVIGKKTNGTFEAKQMLVKCPSKYESENAKKP